MSSATRFLRSREMKEILMEVGGGDMSLWTAARVQELSKIAALAGLALTAMTALGIVAIYPPLFLDSFYLSNSFGALFGISSTIFFVTVAPVVVAQEFAVVALTFILTELIHDVFEASFSHFHDQIASVGLHQFVMSRATTGSPADAMQRFRSSWCNAHVLYMTLQKWLNPVLRLHYGINLIGLTMPWFYIMRGGYVKEGMSWMAFLRPWLWWSFAAVVYSAMVVVPARCGFKLDSLARTGACISSKSIDPTLLQMTLRQDLSWVVVPFRMQTMVAFIMLAPVFGGACAWAIIVAKMLA